VFNRRGNGTCSIQRMEHFSATTVLFPASERAVVLLIPSHQFLYMHTLIGTFLSVSTILFDCFFMSHTEPLACHFFTSLDTHDFVGNVKSGNLL
jgi:hypothetical protein